MGYCSQYSTSMLAAIGSLHWHSTANLHHEEEKNSSLFT